MAGKIIADQIEHSTAGSLDTSYVVNGSAKAWVNFNGTGTIAVRDSLSVSGLVDNGTGNYDINFSSSMADANYSRSTHMQRENTSANFANIDGSYNTDTYSTSTLEVRTIFMNSGASGVVDSPIISNQIFGDLA